MSMIIDMIRLLILIAAVSMPVSARRSPNANYIQNLKNSLEGSDYPDDVYEDAMLDVPSLIAKYGYPVEVHHVETSDGYILELHRIPYGCGASRGNGTAMLLMHGLLSSSADFLTTGPGNALGYILADAGYDVWLGNARGNYYSRRHIIWNPDSTLIKNFWKFSWDEIGNHDLPAFVEHIIQTTGQKKIHYIGHSQGGTSFLVLNSLRPEYNDKFISFQGLAPASFFENNESFMMNALSGYGTIIETTMPVILGHTPAGASIRQIAHYGQVIYYNKFRRFKHNVWRNLKEYGSLTPPTYDLSSITVPSYLHYGLNDVQVDYRDLLKLARNLPNVIGLHPVKRATFDHFDFLWSIDAKEMVYDDVFASMRDAEQRFLSTNIFDQQ